MFRATSTLQAMATTFKLNNGNTIPTLGLGTWLSKPHEVANAVDIALRAGYKSIDCAQIYGNESEVGEGIKKSGVSRKDFFLTSKLWNNAHSPKYVEPALNKTLKDLGVDYLDLYLMHWPVSFKPGDNKFPKDSDGKAIVDSTDFTETWKEMEKMVKNGKCKSIGISNFSKAETERLLKSAEIKPACHQLEMHPYLAQHDFLEWNKKQGIYLAAYSPLGNQNDTYDKGKKYDKIIATEPVKKVAQKHGVDGGQVVLAWALSEVPPYCQSLSTRAASRAT